MQINRLNNIQKLRGFAAILVCCFHARDFLNDFNHLGDKLFIRGSIGVSIFFILSGFIIDYTSNIKKSTTKDIIIYFKNRITRIAPLYYILTLFFVFFIIDTKSYLNDGITRFIKVFLFIPYEKMPPLYVGWSLNYEMFFYLIFGLSLYFRKNRTLFLTLLIISLTSALHLKQYFNIDLLFFINDEHIYNLVTNQLLLQFLLGIIFSKIYKHLKFKKTKAIIFSIILSLTFIIYYFSKLPIGSYDIVFSGMLVLSFLILDRNELFTNTNFLTKLGDISYSFYLIHPIVIILVERFINTHEILFSNFSTFILILIFTYLFSLITFNLIELRITKKLREMLN